MNANRDSTFHGVFTSPHAVATWALVTALMLTGVLLSASALAAPDAVVGKKIYRMRCLSCHGDEKTAGTIGPSLIGIVGRKAATGESGVHSRALMEADITWTEPLLRKFLAAPTKEVPGTIMPVGVPDAQQIDDLVAYLRTLH